MSKDIIGALRVTLGFDTSQFEHGSERAKQKIKTDATAIKAEVSGLRRAIGDLTTAFIGVEAVQAAKRALDYAGSLKAAATEAGVARKELQEYRYVATQTDLTQQEMDGTLKKLTKTIGEAKAGTKEQATLFRDLGVSVQDANGRIYSAGEVLPKLADALSKIKDPATRARLEVKLFGEAGQKLDGLLAQGSKGIELLRQRARELGLVLSDDLADGASEANDRLAEIKMTLDTRFAAAVASNASSILGLANALATLTSNALELVGEYPRISTALAGIAVGSRFGVPGAIAGGVGGAIGGDYLARGNADANMDLKFRMKALQEAKAEMQARLRSTKGEGGLFQIRHVGSNIEGGTLETATAEVRRQTMLLQQATAQANAPRTSTSVVPDGALPVPNPGRTRKGPKDRTEELAQRYRDELAGLYDDQLSLERDLQTEIRERTAFEDERLINAKEAYDKEVDSRVKQGELTAEQAQELKLQRERNFDLEKQKINWDLDDALLEETTRAAQEGLDREKDMLQIRASTATTAKERREIQLAMLDNELKSMRLSAEEVLARHDSTEAEKKLAQAKIDQLGQIRTGETLRINRDTMGPIESYMDSIPKTAEQINEAYENIAANGIRNMVDGLGEAGARTLKLKGFAGQLFNQLIADLIRFQVQQAVGGSGGFLGSILKFGSSILGMSGNSLGGVSASSQSFLDGQAAGIESRNLSAFNFAGGGDMTILGRRGIDRNVLSLNGLPIANVSYGEKLSIANDNPSGRMAAAVYVHPSPYFDAVVDQRAAGVAAPMAQRAAAEGSTSAQVASARARSRAIP
ncbi:hypothetical protein [Sphingomonas bisphenolicum]|uniref:Uncharacterized protein n=1 Tax=Sphingomonas bisphenolicum TaxID=296544 RepID=A0ABM7G2S2_9SPHN|nr:hypothetical protein [Sphingomonas bisphenolicum]BBF70186.1 hypothetical protein SBA_ch1_23860 [Sphingomonas bisphenolicum]